MAKNKLETNDVWVVTNETQKMLVEHVKLLLDQYKTIKGVYGWPNKMLMDLISEYWPDGTSKFFEAFDVWFERELRTFEDNIDEYVEEYAKTIEDIKFSAPNTDHYKMLVGEQTKSWMENYKKVIEQRKQANRTSLETLKKMLPPPVHPMLENANKWMLEQNARIEDEIVKQVEKFSHDSERDKEQKD